MNKTLILATIVALATVMPATVFAGHADDCGDAHDDSEQALGDLYLDADGPGIWEESNSKAGLQTSDVTCDSDDDGVADTTIPADTQIL